KHDTIEDVTETKAEPTSSSKVEQDAEENVETIRSGLKPEHLPVFDCAFKAYRGRRSIHYTAHLKMMAAAQPFISGAISKTVNLPNEATVQDIRNAYVDAWKMGLKCVAIYRDGSMDCIGTLTSMALQYGVPFEALVKKFAHQRFEPSGFTKNPDIRNASSIIDYVFRWMALQFIPEFREANGVKQPDLPIPGLLE